MRWFDRCRKFMGSVLGWRRAERELEEELQTHLEQEIESNRRAGMAEEEAIGAARRLVGSLALHKEGCRDARATAHLESVGRDLRYGGRVLLKNRGFFATASLALALGIGASATLFSLVESQLWRPLPFPNPGKLVAIWERNLKGRWQQTPTSAADFTDWRERTRSFEKMAAMGWSRRRNFAGNGVTERPQVAAISSGFFETLGTGLAAGRPFAAADEQPGKQTKAIVSERVAERAFGSAGLALGKIIRLDGQPYTVTGVMARAFRLEVTQTADIYIPLARQGAARDVRNLVAIGRLRAGVSREQASEDAAAVARVMAAEHPQTNANFSTTVEKLDTTFVADSTRTWLWLSFGFSIFVLLIACANVAGLQLMRAVARQREFALREALGASRLAMMRQRIAESAWIAITGGILGSFVAYGGMQVIRAVPIKDLLPRETRVTLDGWAVLFVVGVSIAATLLFGLAGGSFGAAENVEAGLREAGRGTAGSSRMRLRTEFVAAAQAALAFVSLFGAGLFAASGWALQHVPLGFNPRDVSAVQVPLSGAKYSESEAVRAFYRRAGEQVRAIPGVEEFALASGLPLVGGMETTFYRADRGRPANGQEPFAIGRSVTPGYFHLLGIGVLRGRGFSERDRKDAPRVAMINQNLAERFFRGENPVGKQLHILDGGDAAVPGGTVEIVGVAANVREVGLDEVPFNGIYLPFEQNPVGGLYVVVKSRTASSELPAVRGEIEQLDKGQFIAASEPLDLYVRQQMQQTHFNMWLVGVFAGLSVTLTGVALYGTMSFALAQRTREIGIRIALGAAKEKIFGLLFQSVWKVAVVGAAGGLAAALTLGSIYGDKLYLVPYQHSGLLYGVGIHDPVSLGAAGLVLLAMVIVAGTLPALRATRIDPHAALRAE